MRYVTSHTQTRPAKIRRQENVFEFFTIFELRKITSEHNFLKITYDKTIDGKKRKNVKQNSALILNGGFKSPINGVDCIMMITLLLLLGVTL